MLYNLIAPYNMTHSNKASCPPEQKNFCSIRWYGYFLSSNNIGDVKPTEQMKKVNLPGKEKNILFNIIACDKQLIAKEVAVPNSSYLKRGVGV